MRVGSGILLCCLLAIIAVVFAQEAGGNAAAAEAKAKRDARMYHSHAITHETTIIKKYNEEIKKGLASFLGSNQGPPALQAGALPAELTMLW